MKRGDIRNFQTTLGSFWVIPINAVSASYHAAHHPQPNTGATNIPVICAQHRASAITRLMAVDITRGLFIEKVEGGLLPPSLIPAS